MGQDYYAKNGTYMHLNVAGNLWLSWVTIGVGPKIGTARPLNAIHAQLIARILHNLGIMHKNQQYLSKGGFFSFSLQDKRQLNEIKECCLIDDFEFHEWVSAFFAQSRGLVDEDKIGNKTYKEYEYEKTSLDEKARKDSDTRPVINFEGDLPSRVEFNSPNHVPVQISNTTWAFLTWVGLGLWASPGLPEQITSEEGRILAKMANHIKRLHQYDIRFVQVKGIKQNGGMEVMLDQSIEEGLKNDVGRANIDAAITMLANTPGISIKIH